ncbi:MAG TPA: Sec-independent protein translocase protein TatB [Rhodanobacteraceae bacterium]
MIELSFTKLLLVAVIALLVLGPEKLPKAARMAGAMLRRVRLGWESVRSEVEHELELEEVRRSVRETAERAAAAQHAVQAEVHKVNATANETIAEVGDAVNVKPAAADVTGIPHGHA